MLGRWRGATIAAAFGYAAVVFLLWQVMELLADRAWPATLIAFGPRWLVALPLFPLAFVVGISTAGRIRLLLLAVVSLTGVLLLLGFLDFRLGLRRASGPAVFRVLTQNVGEGQVTAAGLDRMLKAERVDVAAIQECPFYDDDMARLGWHFYYGGDLCLVSRYPFAILDVDSPHNAWKSRGWTPGQTSYRFAIDAPVGRVELMNVHLPTVREGLNALDHLTWGGLAAFASNRAEAARESRIVRDRLREATLPLIVAGDFNLPVESAIYRDSWGDLQNAFSSCGRGFGHTKLTGLFGIRIDHVLASNRWRCAGARVLTSPYGGDHAPLVVDLVLGR